MRVVCLHCPECEAQVHVVWKDATLRCADCDAEMEHFGTVGCVTSVADTDSDEGGSP